MDTGQTNACCKNTEDRWLEKRSLFGYRNKLLSLQRERHYVFQFRGTGSHKLVASSLENSCTPGIETRKLEVVVELGEPWLTRACQGFVSPEASLSDLGKVEPSSGHPIPLSSTDIITLPRQGCFEVH